LHVDGRLIVPGEDGPARQRRKLSFAGIVFVSMVLNQRGDLAAAIEAIGDGLPMGIEGELATAAEQAFGAIPKPRRKNHEALAEAVRTAIRRAADGLWGKKPIVKVVVAEV
jgi:ribonuclease J